MPGLQPLVASDHHNDTTAQRNTTGPGQKFLRERHSEDSLKPQHEVSD